MQFCKSCLYSDLHPFGLTFADGICSGCVLHDEKDHLDWVNRKEKLKGEIKKISKLSRGYDCVVPVIGDAEDYFVLSRVLELGLSPLVVCVNDYFKNDIGWYNLHNLITYFDVDSIVYNPDLQAYQELIKVSMRKFDHILLPFLQLHTSFPVHIAKDRSIPLIIWGQHQAIEQVGKFSHLDEVKMSKWSRKEHDLFGQENTDLIGNGAQLDERLMNFYHYPQITEISKKNIRGLYLSNYFRWDPLSQNSLVINYGYLPQLQSATYDSFERAGSSLYYGLHDLLKYKRVGYRKINDHVSREIRHNRLSRERGVQIVSSYCKQKTFIKPFFDWLGVTTSGYQWYKKFKLKECEHLITDDADENINFLEPPIFETKISNALNKARKPKEEYIFFGKGV